MVLRVLLGLDAADILHLSAKYSGTYAYHEATDTCMRIRESYVPEIVEQFLQSEWASRQAGDYLCIQR